MIVRRSAATAYWPSGLATENWNRPALSFGTVTTSWVVDALVIAAIRPPMLTCGVAAKKSPAGVNVAIEGAGP